MSENKTSSFLKGAMILAVSNILVKIIGAIFKIPLTRIVGEYSMGLYLTAYNYYTILLTIATAGLPIAISKMISESRALNRYSDARRIFKISLMTCAALGAFGTLVMLLGPTFLTRFAPSVYSALFNDPNAVVSLWALAPAVLFIAITAAFRGYFQGHGDMLPTALSQLTEAISRLFIGLALALVLISMNAESKFIAAGAIFGVTTGTILAAVLMLTIHLIRKKKNKSEQELDSSAPRSRGKIFSGLMSIAIPVTVGALVINLTNFIDTVMISGRLSTLGVYSATRTTELFGIYSAYAVSLFNLVPNVLISLNASITPVVAAAYARNDTEDLHGVLTSALRLVIIISAPAAAGIAVLANPILSILFGAGESANIATPVLSILSLASLFLCISSLISTVLQSLGKANIPVYNMLTGACVKFLANYLLIGIPGIELKGAAIGTVLCYLVIALLNLRYLAKFVGFKPNVVKTYLKPLLSTVVMTVVCFGVYDALNPFIGMVFALGISIVVSALVYFFVLIKSGGLTKEDALLLPKGEKIAGILSKFSK